MPHSHAPLGGLSGSAAAALSFGGLCGSAALRHEGMCFTGPMQVQWIGQLLQRPQRFVLHADGKHKLHHGRWVLMTLG
jgi:hypothetical protein